MSEGKASRRDFLGIATFAIGGLISAVVGIPAVAYIVGPALKKEETRPCEQQDNFDDLFRFCIHERHCNAPAFLPQQFNTPLTLFL